VEAAHDEAGAGGVGQGQGEALVAAGVLERVEPDEPDPLDRPATGRLQDRGARRQLVELARDRVDLVEVGVEDRAQALAVRAPGQSVEPAAEAAEAARLDDREDEEQEDREPEPDDGRPDVGGDGGVEIDRWVLRAGVRGGRATAGRV
jgi:hypothetical protein